MTTWASRYQTGKTSLDLNDARDAGVLGCSGIRWTICEQSALRSRQITTPTPHHSIFTGRMLFLTPNQRCQRTEGIQTLQVKREHRHTAADVRTCPISPLSSINIGTRSGDAAITGTLGLVSSLPLLPLLALVISWHFHICRLSDWAANDFGAIFWSRNLLLNCNVQIVE